MTFFITLRIALRALSRNRLRSFLTTLGVIIGVAAVITMTAIGEGAKARIQAAFASMGTNMLVVSPGSTSLGGVRGGSGTMPSLTWDDLTAIRRDVSSVRAAAAVLRSSGSIVSETNNWSTSIQGTSPDYFDVRGWAMSSGSAITQSDVEAGAKVIVLGQTVVDQLFGANADVIGQVVRIRQVPFTVVGVAAKKGQSPMGQDYDDTAFVPQSTFAQKIQGGLGKYLQGTIFVSAKSDADTARAQEAISSLLRERHQLRKNEDDDFQIRNLAEIASAQEEGTKTMTTLLASVAAVSLLVGGIGIMNIMLVSVTERTREIGVRMALGAKPRHVLAQFLIEALVLSIAGGIIGIGLGVGLAMALGKRFDWPVLFQPEVIMVAAGFSALVGIVFGLYPAQKASQLDPIQALRHE
ncbi:MAG TPA: ABC transporter permease [Polyangiaceae bacterium]|nr:ABC transporter permease [Polyangiaceae bacterium]